MAIEIADTRPWPTRSWKRSACVPLRLMKPAIRKPPLPPSWACGKRRFRSWWTAYQRAGIDGLPQQRTGRPVGSGRRLSAEQEQDLRQQIFSHRPDELGIPAALWTRKAVRELIAHAYGMRLPIRTVGLYLQRVRPADRVLE